MTNKELLTQKITENEKQLKSLKGKQENLQINIERLEQKIKNQKFTLEHIKIEKELQPKDQTNVGDNSNIEDLILSKS